MDLSCDTFDIGSYISRYDGYTRLKRLFHILENCRNLQNEVFALLHQELRIKTNIPLYFKLFEICSGNGSIVMDMEWVESVEGQSSAKYRSLEVDLSVAKSTGAKESIRLGHINMGHFHYNRGNLHEAIKSYTRTRDYCSQPRHTVEMCQQVIALYLDLNQYNNISSFVSRALTAMNSSGEITSQMKAVMGLQALHDRNYAVAGKLFCEVGPSLGGSFNYVIAQEDITLYGILCAFATQSKKELRSWVESVNFKLQAELTPDLAQFAKAFCEGKYAACVQYWTSKKSEWLLDIYLTPHVENILNLLEDRIIIAYFAPYDAVDLVKMAASLEMDEAFLVRKLVALISGGQLNGRIDAIKHTLLRNSAPPQTACVETVLGLADKQLGSMKRMVVQMSLLKHNICINSSDTDFEPVSVFSSAHEEGNDDGNSARAEAMDI